MRIISKKPIREFWKRHPESKPALEEWFHKVSQQARSALDSVRAARQIEDMRLNGRIVV